PDSPNMHMLLATADENQRRKYLEPYAKGDAVSAIAVSEPGAGGDPAGMTTRAEKVGDQWVLNGRKIWISRVKTADFTIVMARIAGTKGHEGITAFIVEKGTPGFSVGTIEDKLGIRQSNTAELVFEDCRVPAENILGNVGEGFIVALTALDGGRVGLGAACLGAAKRLLDDCVARANHRERFGKSLGKNQSIQWMLADMATDIHLAEYAVYHAAALTNEYYEKIAHGDPIPRALREKVSRAAAAVKIHCSEMTGRAGERAIQIFGGDGLKMRYRIDRSFRDQVITEIYEGTNEIQRMIIARELLAEGAQ
ncbi:MAG: butyryl-CoA dehydrogenase, partial [Thermoplasmata archaeon]|nr:butyryl-CoA dehydrogenase [Thermoplasmata archaeon]